MTASELLESLNLLDEHERIEAKRASEPGKSVLETVCAFANEPGLGGSWLVLGVVREAGAIDNATYRDLSKVDTLAASQALRRLRDAGLLAQKGRGSATYYVPTERLGPEDGVSSKPEALSSNPAVGLSSNPPALSSNPSALSSNPQALSDESTGLSTKFDEALRSALLDNLPGSLAARLGSIGLRHPPQEIRELVVAMCALRDWRVDELSAVLRRNPEVVRQNYLRPLMKEGRLAMTNPEEPNDPQQAYRTVDGQATG